MVNSIFLGEVGLTSTSANHLANLAKESYMEKEAKLNDISFIDKEVSLLNGDSKPVSFGWKSLDSLKEDLKVISELKGFIAWLREAIKAKEALIKESKTLSMDYFNLSYPEAPERPKELSIEDLGLSYPEEPEDLSYLIKKPLTEEDIISTWSIKKRAAYLQLEAEAATLGIVHPNGSLSKARKNLIKILSKPISMDGSGRDMVVYTCTPSVDSSTVESSFMELQQKFRSVQAELNSLKFEIESAVKADEIRYATDKAKASEDYTQRLAEYNRVKAQLDQLLNDKNSAVDANYQAEYKEYISQKAIIDRQLAEARLKEEKYRSSLKIVIPDCFKCIKKHLEEL